MKHDVKSAKGKHSTLLHSDSGDDNDQTTQPAEVKTTEATTVPKVISNRAHVHLAVEGGSKTSMILPVYILTSRQPGAGRESTPCWISN